MNKGFNYSLLSNREKNVKNMSCPLVLVKVIKTLWHDRYSPIFRTLPQLLRGSAIWRYFTHHCAPLSSASMYLVLRVVESIWCLLIIMMHRCRTCVSLLRVGPSSYKSSTSSFVWWCAAIESSRARDTHDGLPLSLLVTWWWTPNEYTFGVNHSN